MRSRKLKAHTYTSRSQLASIAELERAYELEKYKAKEYKNEAAYKVKAIEDKYLEACKLYSYCDGNLRKKELEYTELENEKKSIERVLVFYRNENQRQTEKIVKLEFQIETARRNNKLMCFGFMMLVFLIACINIGG